jgi:type VI secretion system protein ImpI
MLEVISRQKFALEKSSSHVFSEVGGYIGRDRECEWCLPDKSKQLSRKHILITTDENNFYLEDLSTNGTYLVLGRERIPKGMRYKIDHGVSFYVGDYTIQAKLLFKPDTHLPKSVSADVAQLIPDDAFLDLDPLVAMEQQDEFEARRRLGYTDDLLGEIQAKTSIQSDHNEPTIDNMLRIKAIPEDWEAAKESPSSIDSSLPLPDPEPLRHVITVPETEVFFRILGFTSVPESPEERERILTQAAELLLAAVDGMLQSLRNRADSKNDLRLTVTTMTLASNNPLKFSPTAKAALDYLLAPQQEGVLPPAQAMLSGFNDLHSHHMGLLAGARAAVRASLDRIAPERVEARLDSKGSSRFNKKAQLWQTFGALHQKLIADPDFFAAAFLQDFARAYEVQVRTLHPIPDRIRREA